MRPPEIDFASVVMIGSFNPAIFQPRWLGAQQLIRAEEAESAKIAIIRAEVADFSTEWFQIQVLQNRFQILSKDPRQFLALRDLAASIFSILPHTPVSALGLNRQLTFKMPSSEIWHALGHLLAPKRPWEPIMDAPGLRSMVMQGRRKQQGGGLFHVKVEPSATIEHGVSVEVNEEFKPNAGSEAEGAHWIPETLAEHWGGIMKFSEEAAEHLLDLVGT